MIEGEDEKSLVELGKRIRAEINPTGEVELILADRIIANIWRLRGLHEVERETMNYQREKELTSSWNKQYLTEDQAQRKATREMLETEDTEVLLRYEAAIKRGIYEALYELQRIQGVRVGEKLPAPIAVDIDISQD